MARITLVRDSGKPMVHLFLGDQEVGLLYDGDEGFVFFDETDTLSPTLELLGIDAAHLKPAKTTRETFADIGFTVQEARLIDATPNQQNNAL